MANWYERSSAGGRGRVGPERPHARPGPTGGGGRVAGALEDVEKVLIRVVGCPDRVRQVGLAAVAVGGRLPVVVRAARAVTPEKVLSLGAPG